MLWNGQLKHNLANNQALARSILFSTLKKHRNDDVKLGKMNENILEHEEAEIIERVTNLDPFLAKNPTASFLGHMPVFRLSKETTKCRIVFLSNVCEKDTATVPKINHNMAMFSEPCINHKLAILLMILRFDPKLLCFDLRKAFCLIELPEDDRNKLMFLWFRNVKNNDFTVQAFRNLRLSFGLRCSPTILKVGLYIIHIRDTQNDSEKLKDLKERIYGFTYMDNCAITGESVEYLQGPSTN